jgi:hypothetical protein
VLFGLAAVTGIIDAACYLAFGHVFTANMTGNVVLLGLAQHCCGTQRRSRSVSLAPRRPYVPSLRIWIISHEQRKRLDHERRGSVTPSALDGRGSVKRASAVGEGSIAETSYTEYCKGRD